MESTGFNSGGRYPLLDCIRGMTLLSMILYHGTWDLVYIYGMKWKWYGGAGAYIWQQSICWTFIFLSGFCWPMGKRPLKRGLTVFGGGLLVSLVTCLAMPENRVIYGVLTMTGSCMLLMKPLERLAGKLLPEAGLIVSLGLFALTRNVNEGYLGFEAFRFAKLPASWYRNMVSAYFGFPAPSFFSTDYFSLFPWLFLFIGGYYSYHILYRRNKLKSSCFYWDFAPLSFLGRHCLLIYLLHQPVIYLLCVCVFGF